MSYSLCIKGVVGLFVLSLLLWSSELVQSQPPTLVKVDGSSTVFPITEAVAEEFQKERPSDLTAGDANASQAVTWAKYAGADIVFYSDLTCQ